MELKLIKFHNTCPRSHPVDTKNTLGKLHSSIELMNVSCVLPAAEFGFRNFPFSQFSIKTSLAVPLRFKCIVSVILSLCHRSCCPSLALCPIFQGRPTADASPNPVHPWITFRPNPMWHLFFFFFLSSASVGSRAVLDVHPGYCIFCMLILILGLSKCLRVFAG